MYYLFTWKLLESSRSMQFLTCSVPESITMTVLTEEQCSVMSCIWHTSLNINKHDLISDAFKVAPGSKEIH